MVKWALLFVVSGIVVLFTTLYFNLGVYKEVQIEQVDHPSFFIIYKKHEGPYHKIAPVIIEVETWAAKNNVDCSRTFGEYIDNPSTTEQDRLRSNGGCVVGGTDDVFGIALPEGFKARRVEAMKILRARFAGAPSIGPFVVYPEVDEWVEKNRLKINGPVFEVYNIQGDKSAVTEYLFPL